MKAKLMHSLSEYDLMVIRAGGRTEAEFVAQMERFAHPGGGRRLRALLAAGLRRLAASLDEARAVGSSRSPADPRKMTATRQASA